MEQREAAVTITTAAKKLARQLDFTATAESKPSAVNVLWPEDPQTQLQSKLFDPAKPPPGVPVGLPPAKPVQERWKQSVRAVLRVAHPLNRPSSEQLIQKDSPKSQDPTNAESKDASRKKQKQCNCKYSKCLKLYCECFTSGIYCYGCTCTNCHNSSENEAERKEAIETILERNSDAFRQKIANSPLGPRDGTANLVEARKATIMGKHNKGCNCKKSGCLKKYCECFQASVPCSDNCKCKGCKNVEGSRERISLFNEGPVNPLTRVNQAVNAAILGVTRSSGFISLHPIKKRKTEQLSFGAKSDDETTNRLEKFRQEIDLTPPVTSSSPSLVPSSGTIANVSGSSKPTYRSLLLDILQLQHLEELCSHLVVVSAEAANKISERKHMITKGDIEHVEYCIAPSTQQSRDIHDRDDVQMLSSSEINWTPDHACQSAVVDRQTGRTLSPETLALICDERDTITTRTDSLTGFSSLTKNATVKSSCLDVFNEVDAEQEKLILTKFCGFLNQLITCGSIKANALSSQAFMEILPAEPEAREGNSKATIVDTSPDLPLMHRGKRKATREVEENDRPVVIANDTTQESEPTQMGKGANEPETVQEAKEVSASDPAPANVSTTSSTTLIPIEGVLLPLSKLEDLPSPEPMFTVLPDWPVPEEASCSDPKVALNWVKECVLLR